MKKGLNDDDGVNAQADPHDGTHQSRSMLEDRTVSQSKMPYFGVPVVGFFRPRPVKTNLGERASFANNDTGVVNYGTSTQDGIDTNSSKKKSGKVLWAKLRKHVFNESFHIQDALKDDESRKRDIHFNDVDLPYEFSLLHCFLALAAYLLISIIAFSFVFEHWTIIDSLYFAVATL